MPSAFERLIQRSRELCAKEALYMQHIIEEKPEVFLEALEEEAENCKRYPVYYRLPLESLIRNADVRRQRYQSQLSSRGGKAKKSGELGKLIEDIVKKAPYISRPALLAKLRDRQGIPPIAEIDEDCITLSNGAVVELSGLKDRLSRAKKKLNSQNR